MANEPNEFELQDKISTIRSALSRLDLNFKPAERTYSTPFQAPDVHGSPIRPKRPPRRLSNTSIIKLSHEDFSEFLLQGPRAFPVSNRSFEQLDQTNVVHSPVLAEAQHSLVATLKEELEASQRRERKYKKALKQLRQENESLRKQVSKENEYPEVIFKTQPAYARLNLKGTRPLLNLPSKRSDDQASQRPLDTLSTTFDSASKKPPQSAQGFSRKERRVRTGTPSCPRVSEWILQEVSRELGVDSSSEVLQALKELKQQLNQAHMHSRLVDKLTALASQCLSSGTASFSTRKLWKWLRTVIEDYAKMKQAGGQLDLSKVKALLGLNAEASLAAVESRIKAIVLT